MVNKDPKVDQISREVGGFDPTSFITPSARGPNNCELDATKILLNTQLIKLQDAASAALLLLYQFVTRAVTCFGKSEKPAPVPSNVPFKDHHNEHNSKPFLNNPIITPVPIHVKGDALLFRSDIHTQLRQEAARNAASQPGSLTDDDRFSTIPAHDLEYTNIQKRFNSRGNKSDNNSDGKQQFPGFPSQNSPS